MKVIGPYVMSAVSQAAAPVSGREAPTPGGPAHPRVPQRRKTDPPALASENAWAPTSPVPASTSPVSASSTVSANPVPMHGLDRLTGMPVLLHRLSHFLVPLPLPASPYLLPVGEVDVWDAQPYAVTELPLSASPVTDPLLAAQGALRALAALHGAGLVHGGLNAAQLWQVGRGVRLAGAGLPWDGGATAETDMQALGQVIDTMGLRPAALRDLEQLTAEQALERLSPATEPASADRTTLVRAAVDVRPPETGSAATGAEEPRSPASARPAPVQAEARSRPEAEQPTEEMRPEGGSVEPAPPSEEVLAATGAVQDGQAQEADSKGAEVQEVLVVRPAATLPASGPPVTGPPVTELPVTELPVSELPVSGPPARYRLDDDIIVIGDLQRAEGVTETGDMLVSDTPAGRAVQSPQTGSPPTGALAPEQFTLESELQPPVNLVPVRLVPAPIRIGFDGLPASPTDWTPGDAAPRTVAEERLMKGEAALADFAHGAPAAAEPTTGESAPSGSAGLNTEPLPAGVAPEFGADGPASGATASIPGPVQRQTGRTTRTVIGGGQVSESTARGQPLRIGWEEDHSWRVVKSGPERGSSVVRRLPIWLPVMLLVLVLGGVALWLAGRTTVPAAACCTQRFMVSGSTGSSGTVPVKVTLVQGPPGSSLLPGALIGTLNGPGTLNFPDAPGRYILRFSAQGHGTLSGAVTVPSVQPFKIVLK